MNTAIAYPHLTFDADGGARVEGTRYKVQHLAGEHFHYGWSAKEILRQHPDLRPEQVYSALTYFFTITTTCSFWGWKPRRSRPSGSV